MDGLSLARERMEAAGLPNSAVEVFSHYHQELAKGSSGLVPEADIAPMDDPVALADVEVDDDVIRDAIGRTVVIKLNGGLGTSMGMSGPKTLVDVREGRTFLDFIVDQVRAARTTWGVRLPLVFMNSFRTHAPTMDALSCYDDIAVDDIPLDFLQNRVPKLRVDDLTPVDWPDDPDLEWCPPGHGDLYTALLGSGMLDILLSHGFRYAAVSNGDNLGASPDARLAGWFSASGAPFAMEVARRTVADRKGGHLAVRTADGQLVLREVAQVPDEDKDAFADHTTHRWFNTNNLWLDLEALARVLAERDGVLGLPMIRNIKHVDPSDSSSPEVYQLETAMGAAVEVFRGATAIAVDRTRFRPVKTTNDLLLLRSDAYTEDADGILHSRRDADPVIDLDPDHYKLLPDFEARFPAGTPSLAEAERLTVRGDWTFGADVVVRGAVELAGDGGRIADGTLLEAHSE